MTMMPKEWYEARIIALSDRLDNAKAMHAADERALKEAQRLHAESRSLVEELEETIYGLQRELDELEKGENQ